MPSKSWKKQLNRSMKRGDAQKAKRSLFSFAAQNVRDALQMADEQEQEGQQEVPTPLTDPPSADPSASLPIMPEPGVGEDKKEDEMAREKEASPRQGESQMSSLMEFKIMLQKYAREQSEIERAAIESASAERTKERVQSGGGGDGENAMEEGACEYTPITPTPTQQQAEMVDQNAGVTLVPGAGGQPAPQIAVSSSLCSGREGAGGGGGGEESQLQRQMQAIVEGWCGPKLKALAREVSKLKEANEKQAEEIARLRELLGTTGTTLQKEKIRVDVIDQRTEREVVERARIEDGWRKNNIRLVGLPERSEEQDLTAFVRDNINKWAPTLKNKRPDIVHAGRVGSKGQGNNRGPRTVVVRLQNYQDRADILKETRQHTPEGRGRPPLLFFPDFSPYTAARRRALNPAMKKAKELGLDPFLQYPANLLLGETRTPCTTPEEAESFMRLHELSTNSLRLAPPPAAAHTTT